MRIAARIEKKEVKLEDLIRDLEVHMHEHPQIWEQFVYSVWFRIQGPKGFLESWRLKVMVRGG
jgi:hypothetical protein